MNERCVIVTGTIVPNIVLHGHEDVDIAVQGMELVDPLARRSRYLETLSLYASIMKDEIYFLENSSYDFSKDTEFRELFRKTGITLVKFPRSKFVERGKGFQEFEMLDEFVRSVSGQYRHFVKLSGRYQYRNISSLIDAHFEGALIDMNRSRRVAITSIFCATFDFYKKHLLGLYLLADDRQGAWIERRLYERLRDRSFRQSVHLFPTEPDLKLWSVFGRHERGTALTHLKRVVRNGERAILRKLMVNELYL